MAVDPFTWLVHGVTTSLSLATTKNIFTTVFFILSLLITFFGGRWLTRQAHGRILKHEAVPVNSLVPWLSTTSALQYIWIMRKLPAGLFGLLMIVSGCFSSVLSPFIVNTYVVQIEGTTLCQFTRGVVATWYQGNSNTVVPSAVWPVAKMAVGAQDIAIAAGLKPGIFSKIDNNYTNIYPRHEDFLGFWDCKQEGYSILEPTDVSSTNAVSAWSEKQSFLYTNYTWPFGETVSGRWTAMVDLGFNQPGNSTEPWNMTAIIATNLDGETPANASNFHCSLNITQPDWTPPCLLPEAAFAAWGDTIVGMMLDVGVGPNLYYQQLEVALNAMTIVAGTGNGRSANASLANITGAGTEFQCLEPINHIKNPVCILLLLLSLILAFVIIPDLYDLSRTWFSKSGRLEKKLPFQLLDWQLEIIQNSTGDKSIDRRQLNEFEYVWEPSTSTYLCRRNFSKKKKV